MRFEKKAQDAASTAHERAARGDDPGQIQKDVYAALRLSNVPPTDMGTKRKADFIPSEGDEVFRLRPGEVSQIEKEPKSYAVYKVVSKDTPHEEQVRDEIAKELSQQNTKAATQAVTDSAQIEFNTQYFGPTNPKPVPTGAPTSPTSVQH